MGLFTMGICSTLECQTWRIYYSRAIKRVEVNLLLFITLDTWAKSMQGLQPTESSA